MAGYRVEILLFIGTVVWRRTHFATQVDHDPEVVLMHLGPQAWTKKNVLVV